MISCSAFSSSCSKKTTGQYRCPVAIYYTTVRTLKIRWDLLIPLLTNYIDVEATACHHFSTTINSHPHNKMPADRERVPLIIVARRHGYILHICARKLPFEAENHFFLVRIQFFYSVHGTSNPRIRIDFIKMRKKTHEL